MGAVDPWPRVPVLATVPATARLSLSFDVERLRSEVARLRSREWQQPRIYSGEGVGRQVTNLDWRTLSLRSIGGDPERTDPGGPAMREYADTPWLAKVPYLRKVVEAIPAPTRSVRLMSLGPGAVSPTHSDTKYGFPWGTVRLHVPVVTTPGAVLVIDGEEHCWQAGGLWYADFTRGHLVRNTDVATRVHMVIDCHLTQELLALFPASFQTPDVYKNSVWAAPESPLSPAELEGFRCAFAIPESFSSFEEADDEFLTSRRGVRATIDVLNGRLTLFFDGEPTIGLVHAGNGEFRFAGWTMERTIQIRPLPTGDGAQVTLRVRAGARCSTLELRAEQLTGPVA